MKEAFDRRKSLQELAQDDWGEPKSDDTGLVKTCYRLRRKPLNDFTVEDLRVMIGQKIARHRLVPIALEKLEENPLAEGDYYIGDLLAVVLRIEKPFWENRSALFGRVSEVIGRIPQLLPSLDDVDRKTAQDLLAEAERQGFDDPLS